MSQCAIGYGYCVSAACESQVDASTLSNVVTLPSLFFGGIFANGKNTLPGVNWIQYLSPIRFGFEGLMDAEYKNTLESRALTLFNI